MKETPNVCLLLEGTYPFVSGGVSSWVHQLATKLSDITFYVVHISPSRGYYASGPVYTMPKNVLGLQEVILHEYGLGTNRPSSDRRDKVLRFRSLINDMREGRIQAFEEFLEALGEDDSEGLDSFDLLQTRESWDVLIETYKAEAAEESFLNFFWTWRFAYMPLFNVLAAQVPDAGVYHTISTGYAGLLAAASKLRKCRPAFLTEHGIYTKERRIEINRAQWIEDWDSGEIVAERNAPYFKRYWVRQFEMMSNVTYHHCDRIYTLYEGNKTTEILDGADPDKITVVPNGIDLEKFGEAADKYDARPENERYTIGFVGRVCPIKDVKTLIYASRLVAEEIPDVNVRIMGPMDEDPEYADDCHALIELLELTNNVVLEGPVMVLDEYWKIDILVLTSISEAQPLVVLEAGAVGLPTVGTDVGSCSELLFGRTLEDKKIGPGGIITPIATPGATAEALIRMHKQPEERKQMGLNMRERVQRLYAQSDMIGAYHDIYTSGLELSAEMQRERKARIAAAAAAAKQAKKRAAVGAEEAD